MADNRSCTDPWCCPVFIAFLVGLVIAFGYGLAKGDPALLMTPVSQGKGCGYSEGYQDYGYLYWPKIVDNTGKFDVNFGTELLKNTRNISF